MPDYIPQDLLEERLLSSIASLTNLHTCVEAGITTASFVKEEHKAAWTYLLDHTSRMASLPIKEDVYTMTGFEPQEAGDLGTYIVEVTNRQIGRRTREVLSKIIPTLDIDPAGSVQTLSHELQEIRLGAQRRLLRVDRDASTRLALYDLAAAAAASGEILGVPTGLKWFTDHGYGHGAGEIVSFIGTTGVGKSFLMLYEAAVAYEAGKRVLVFSPEMTSTELATRFDVICAQLRGITFSLEDIQMGRGGRAAYAEFLQSLEGRDDLTFIDSSDVGRGLTYDDVATYTYEEKPDLVCIDGLDLLASNDSKGKQGWEVIKEGGRFLKATAQQARVPILLVSQGDRATARNPFTPPGKADVAYGYSISTISDTMIGLARHRQNQNMRVYMVQKMRGKKESNTRHYLDWDVDHGIIREIEFEGLEDGEEY